LTTITTAHSEFLFANYKTRLVSILACTSHTSLHMPLCMATGCERWAPRFDFSHSERREGGAISRRRNVEVGAGYEGLKFGSWILCRVFRHVCVGEILQRHSVVICRRRSVVIRRQPRQNDNKGAVLRETCSRFLYQKKRFAISPLFTPLNLVSENVLTAVYSSGRIAHNATHVEQERRLSQRGGEDGTEIASRVLKPRL
jgi:hypothetical protein